MIITEDEANQRVDRFLKKYLRQAPLSAIYKILRKDIKVNAKRVKEGTVLCQGDEVTLYISDEELEKLSKRSPRKHVKKQFKIAYEDDKVLIVEKPWGLLTHGDSFEKKNTLANQVCGYLQEQGEYDPSRARSFTPSPVNRLDRNTTGLVIFGKTAESLRVLTEVIRNRDEIKKYYLTIVAGTLKEELFLAADLVKDGKSNVVKVVENGKSAYTSVRPVSTGKEYSLAEVELVTGRTHQIRAHMAHAGFPLIGDVKYGNRKVNYEMKEKYGLTTQLLHAYKLEFDKMPNGFRLLDSKVIKSELPPDFERIMKGLNLCKGE
ncbi:MAG: RluA family pseudouridine synthase [Clostridiales bacterium]|nr:RluA family pseudouridine synthase [Clostridiales bacterium]